MADSQALAKLVEGCIIELSTIVGDDNTMKFEVADYRHLNELLDLLLSDSGQRLSSTHLMK